MLINDQQNQNFRINADDTEVYKSHSDPVW